MGIPDHTTRGPRQLASLSRFFIHRQFAWLWTAQTISAFGSHITSIGLPLAALLLLHATPAQMGVLTALGAVPGLLAGPFIGVWVDRLPRRLVMIGTDLGRAGLLVLIPLAAVSGLLNMGWFLGITALTGLLTIGFEVASLSFLPQLLPSDRLAEGNSRLETSSSLAEIAGPPLAGLLVQLLTAPVAILLDALSFLGSALCLSSIGLPEPARTEPDERPGFGREMREGLLTLVGNPLLRSLAAYLCTQTLFGGAYAALYLFYTVQLFGNSPFAYSFCVAMGGAGSLVGSFIADRVARRFGRGRTLLGSALFFGLLSFCTPLAVGPAPVLLVLLGGSQLLGDTGYAIYAINEISLRQTLVPERLLGRVNVGMQMLANGALPVGALLAGLLAGFIGIRLTLLVASGGFLLACVWLIFSPVLRYR